MVKKLRIAENMRRFNENREGLDSQFHYYDEIIETEEFQNKLYQAMLEDDWFKETYDYYNVQGIELDDILYSLSHDPEEINLMKPSVIGAYVKIMGHKVDMDDMADAFSAYCSDYSAL